MDTISQYWQMMLLAGFGMSTCCAGIIAKMSSRSVGAKNEPKYYPYVLSSGMIASLCFLLAFISGLWRLWMWLAYPL